MGKTLSEASKELLSHARTDSDLAYYILNYPLMFFKMGYGDYPVNEIPDLEKRLILENRCKTLEELESYLLQGIKRSALNEN